MPPCWRGPLPDGAVLSTEGVHNIFRALHRNTVKEAQVDVSERE